MNRHAANPQGSCVPEAPSAVLQMARGSCVDLHPVCGVLFRKPLSENIG